MLAAVLSVSSVMTSLAAKTAKAEVHENYVWTRVEENWTCQDEDGEPVKGWALHGNDLYFLDKNGVMRTGWIKSEGKWYYFYEPEYIKAHTLKDVKAGTLAVSTSIGNYEVDAEGAMTKIR